ncbi:MAG: exodeoxyribonuclease VII large subunit [Victivallaceae bacterium]|nr:exodeoxyribonuclease VII large subunit [Victivallaceae bacterium]
MSQEKIWQVYEVNSVVRELLENSFHPFWLEGEVGTLHIHRSGHVYLTLKDRRSQIKAVFFGGANQANNMNLRVGMAVEVYGQLTAYEVRGEYQFSVKTIRPVGVGALQRKFEELKAKLEAEGLFSPERKKPIPVLPRTIGVITAPGGAAIRDFLQIINRRFPDVNIKIYPVQVQGVGAAEQIARGVGFFNRKCPVDVLVLTRGGGSIEDLWSFNEEVVARAVATSVIPVISAVGHEIDFTICDFVADLRVPTPSAAAELVIGQRDEFIARVNSARKNMARNLHLKLEQLRNRYKLVSGSYVFREPAHLLRQQQQQLDELSKALNSAIADSSIIARTNLNTLQLRLAGQKSDGLIRQEQLRLTNLRHNLQVAAKQQLNRYSTAFMLLEGRLQSLNPTAVLQRGYSILSYQGKTVTSAAIPTGTELIAQVADGTINLTVTGSKQN